MFRQKCVLLFAVLLAACSSAPSQSQDAGTDAGGSTGGSTKTQSTPPNLTVSLTSPTSDVTTNGGIVGIQVLVEGGTADAVTLTVDDKALVVLPPPYSFAWDTEMEAAGAHKVQAAATAGAKSFKSGVLTVTVDFTGPHVDALAPAIGTDTGCISESLTVHFSEALDPTTVVADDIKLSGTAFPTLGKTLTLSADQQTLTITPDTLVPGQALVELGFWLKDSIGNAVQPLTESWTFSVLPFCVRGGAPVNAPHTDARTPVIAVQNAEDPIVAWQELGPGQHVARAWANGSWSPAEVVDANAGPLAIDADSSSSVQLAVGSGNGLGLWQDGTGAWANPAAAAPVAVNVSEVAWGAGGLELTWVEDGQIKSATTSDWAVDTHLVNATANSASSISATQNGWVWQEGSTIQLFDWYGGFEAVRATINGSAPKAATYAGSDLVVYVDPSGVLQKATIGWGNSIEVYAVTPLSMDTLATASAPAVAALPNNLAVAWIETRDGLSSLYLYTETNVPYSQHTTYGPLNIARGVGKPANPALALRADGKPVLTFEEPTAAGAAAIYVRVPNE